MTQRVSLRDSEFSGTLTFSRAPRGELTFKDGVAEVDDDVDVGWLVDRYPNLTAGDAPAPDESESDDSDADESESDTDDESDEFDEMDYDELQSRAGEHDDIKGNQSADDLRAALREKEA